jgi:4-diphosphocytidyl-2-C-methyl-D-erythritol kinase
MKLIINSPAKINFGLFITEKRPDRYHNIETIFYPLELADEIIMRECDHILIETDSPSLNVNPEGNLIYKAVKLMEKLSGKNLKCRINLKKNIPLGAGLGGGSSNAASVLLGLNDLFNLEYSKQELKEIGLQLGSDVPFFVHPYPSFGSGRGEVLEEINLELHGSLVIVNPNIHVATKTAYENCIPNKASFDLHELNNLNGIDYNKIKPFVLNSFEETVFALHPEIGEIKKKMYLSGAQFSLMSGSGSTVFGIYSDKNKAEGYISTLPTNYFNHLEVLDSF